MRELFLSNRIFYTSSIIQKGDGYYYRNYKFLFYSLEASIFAGYKKHALNSDKTTFEHFQNLHNITLEININDNTKTQNLSNQEW